MKKPILYCLLHWIISLSIGNLFLSFLLMIPESMEELISIYFFVFAWSLIFTFIPVIFLGIITYQIKDSNRVFRKHLLIGGIIIFCYSSYPIINDYFTSTFNPGLLRMLLFTSVYFVPAIFSTLFLKAKYEK